MVPADGACTVLIISSNPKVMDFLSGLLPQNKFSPLLAAATVGEAKRLLVSQNIDIAVINTPLPDDFGIQFAIELSEKQNCGVLLFVKPEVQEGVCQKVEDFGILTLAKPITRAIVFQSMNLLVASRAKIRILQEKATTLESRMQEIRLVNRAKLLLIEHLKMSEAEAHRYIEKTAMDQCVKKQQIAENLIKIYENK